MSLQSPLICVAPMMDYTDRHDRYFLRLLAPHVRLYTEMITSHALIHGDANTLLAFHPAEKYLALQVGGCDPAELALCAKMGEDSGYDEINLNVGCPSSRVKAGRFGACLMLEPQRVAECVAAMQAQVTIPVTVKCRIGVDQHDSYASLQQFIDVVQTAGCRTFIIHARKAWLSGLSPKQNRDIPPLCYETVYQIKNEFSMLNIIINGGIKTLTDVQSHLIHVDGVMLGREAYANPYFLAEIESDFFSLQLGLSRKAIVQRLLPYIEEQLKNGVKLASIARHVLGLYRGQRGASVWRRYLSQEMHKSQAGINVIEKALELVAKEA